MTTRRQFMVMALSALGAALLEAGCGDAEGEVDPGPASNDVVDPGFEPAEPINDFEASLPPTALGLTALLSGWFEGADLEAIKAVGRAYVARFNADAASITTDLGPTVSEVAAFTHLNPALVAWQEAIGADFDAANLVVIAGWQLSPTEVRLCALADGVL